MRAYAVRAHGGTPYALCVHTPRVTAAQYMLCDRCVISVPHSEAHGRHNIRTGTHNIRFGKSAEEGNGGGVSVVGPAQSLTVMSCHPMGNSADFNGEAIFVLSDDGITQAHSGRTGTQYTQCTRGTQRTRPHAQRTRPHAQRTAARSSAQERPAGTATRHAWPAGREAPGAAFGRAAGPARPLTTVPPLSAGGPSVTRGTSQPVGNGHR